MAITITYPESGFALSGSYWPVEGTATGGLSAVTIRVNGVNVRVTVSAETFSHLLNIPESPTPQPITIDAFDGFTFESSTVFSNTVTGIASNIPAPQPGPRSCDPNPAQWIEEGYETLLQSEFSLYESDDEKTVRNLSLDFTHAEEFPPLFCHSQLGVGGLANCIDWWNSEPWPLDCNLFGNIDPTKRNTGPMSWPYYATGRYIGWRMFMSDQNDPPGYEPVGGVIDLTRVSLTMSVKSSCR